MAYRLLICLIGSILLHGILFMLVARMSPAAPLDRHAVDAFIVESALLPVPETKRSGIAVPKADIGSQQLKKAQVQPVLRALPDLPVGQKAVLAALPPSRIPLIKVAPVTGPLPAQSVQSVPSVSSVPAKVVALAASSTRPGSAPAGALPAGSLPEGLRGEKPQGNASAISHSGTDTGQVLALGEAGAPRFLHREAPGYPSIARKLGKEGRTVLRLALDARGLLQGVEVIETSGFGFAEAASAAIRKSTFAPAVRGGKPVASRVLVPVRFVLHDGQ